MKKILIGICDFGNGHTSRQMHVAKKLLEKNYEVAIAVSKSKWEYIKNIFPTIKLFDINIPWLFCNEEGLYFEEIIKKTEELNIDYFKSFIYFSKEVLDFFKGKPDLIIADYEPNVAKLSYAMNIPLLTMEQQSKFIDLENLEINSFTIKDEINRLNYIYPFFEKKYISSFFPVKSKNKNHRYLPPIIDFNENNIYSKTFDPKKIVVYFSPYSFDEARFNKVLNLLSLNKYKDFNIIIYSNHNFENYYKVKNFKFKSISKIFNQDIKDAYFVISTAGHQLISELIYKGIPVLLLPFDTYEQNYNAKMVEKYKLGCTFNKYNENEIDSIILENKKLRYNIKKYKGKYLKKNWEEIFDKNLRKDFKL